jgi:hypothetical protein
MNAAMVIGVYFGFRETRGSVLLSRKAHALNSWYETCEQAGHVVSKTPAENNDKSATHVRIRWKVKSDEERESLRKILKTSLTRPFCTWLAPFLRHYISACILLRRLPFHTQVQILTQISLSLRPPRYRTRRILLLPLGGLRLGRPLHVLLQHPPRLRQPP